MVKIGTSCLDCCFLNEDKNCQQGLHSIFLNQGDEIISNESEVRLNRVCQYKRSIDWNDDKSIENRISICKDEVYISGTILLISNNKENLEKIIDKLNTSSRIKNFKFLILYTNIKSKDLLEICGNKIKSSYRLILNTSSDLNDSIYRSLKYAKNGYFFILDSSKDITDNIFDKVNNFVNIKMYRLLHIKPTDGLHQSVSMVHLYKYIKGDIEMDFADKLKDISIQENSNAQVFSWEEINEQYTD